MVTLLDVAARAGVSRSTVSLVINKSPLVKDETRQSRTGYSGIRVRAKS